jgi:putative toxin-antitoxin system antitoxin component (TIGR02293 family)
MSTHLLAPPIDLTRATALVQKGLPWSEVEFLAEQLGVTLAEFSELLGVSEPTFFRRRKQKRFTPDESDHIMRFARLWSMALETFEQEEGARTWLKAPAIGLKGRVPLQVSRSETGAREVEALLQRIDYGIP